MAGWCAAKGLDVTRPDGTECDRIIENLRAEIKFSTLWKAGVYKFQQLRDQAYDVAVCLGVSPFDAHCWAIPKDVAMSHAQSQHGGRRGRDTAWLAVNPDDVPQWLREWGGRLAEAYLVLRKLGRGG